MDLPHHIFGKSWPIETAVLIAIPTTTFSIIFAYLLTLYVGDPFLATGRKKAELIKTQTIKKCD